MISQRVIISSNGLNLLILYAQTKKLSTTSRVVWTKVWTKFLFRSENKYAVLIQHETVFIFVVFQFTFTHKNSLFQTIKPGCRIKKILKEIRKSCAKFMVRYSQLVAIIEFLTRNRGNFLKIDWSLCQIAAVTFQDNLGFLY